MVETTTGVHLTLVVTVKTIVKAVTVVTISHGVTHTAKGATAPPPKKWRWPDEPKNEKPNVEPWRKWLNEEAFSRQPLTLPSGVWLRLQPPLWTEP
jgi:hypothetical protein